MPKPGLTSLGKLTFLCLSKIEIYKLNIIFHYFEVKIKNKC